MWKNFLSFLSNLGLLSFLGLVAFTHQVCAQVDTEGSLSNLLVTSHVIGVNQGLREKETFYYGIIEEMEIENPGTVSYQDDLAFWVGEGEDLRVVAFEENGNGVDLEVSTNEGIATARLKERVFIKPRQKLKVSLDYKIFFTDEGKKEEFRKKILSPHTKESLQFQVNPIENLGFRPNLSGFPMEKSKQAGGLFVSPLLSPKAGEVYTLMIVKEEGEQPVTDEERERKETPRTEEERETEQRPQEEREPIIITEEIGKIPEQIRIFPTILKRWIWENILVVLLLNDALVLSLVGYKCGWFKDFHRKTSRLARLSLLKRKKRGK